MEYTQKQVENILAIAAHEVASPLASLKMAVDMISRTCKCPDTRHIEMARKAIRRTDILVKELLNASYLATGGVPFHMEPVKMEDVVMDVVQEMSYHVDHDCEIRTHINAHGLYVTGDSAKLEQVMANLISNACKYAPHKPIDVIVTRQGNNAQVEVRDHGEGISADKMEIIFEKFERDIRANVQVHGLGLGLWICREIVQQHGGKVFARNVDNNGAAFIVQMPLIRG